MSKYSIKLNVLVVQQPLGKFFIASIKARELVTITYSDVRRLASEERDVERYLGIQRPLNKQRVKEIRKYIEGSDATFPTAVIVAVDERCASYEPTSRISGILTLSSYVPGDDEEDEEIPKGKIAKVLDGQHRIAAFMNENDQYSFLDVKREFDINLSIFVGADISEQASIFATVNLSQTKVNRSLAYDLTELANARSPYQTCHNVAVALDQEQSSPFFERIKRLGTATPGRTREPLTQAAFVESLVRLISKDPVTDRNSLLDGVPLKKATSAELEETPFRNLFIYEKDTDIAEIIYNYFDAVRQKWPKSWDDLATPGNILPKSNAFKAFMKFLHEDAYPQLASHKWGRVPTAEEFGECFEGIILRDSDFTTRQFLPGSTGQAMFLKVLRKEVTRREMLEDA